jgi:hypothetical protein
MVGGANYGRKFQAGAERVCCADSGQGHDIQGLLSGRLPHATGDDLRSSHIDTHRVKSLF